MFLFEGPRGSPGILPRSLDHVFATLGNDVAKDIRMQPCRYEDIMQLDTQAQKDLMARRETFLAQKAPKYPKAPEPVAGSSRSASQVTDPASHSTGSVHSGASVHSTGELSLNHFFDLMSRRKPDFSKNN